MQPSYRVELAKEMENVYLSIKNSEIISIKSLAKECNLSLERTRGHIGFFDWYGVATKVVFATDDSGQGYAIEAVLVTEKNKRFVETKFTTVTEFFHDAYIETFPLPE